MKNTIYLFSGLALFLISCGENKKAGDELYKSTNLTAENSFTGGAEGPAVNAEGVLFAVNFEKEGTIGKINSDGSGEVFVALPDSSVGNGIRFGSNGIMYVADYVNHNVLAVDPQTREVTIYAHSDSVTQPNDVAIADNDIIFASDPNWKESTGRIWRVESDGQFELLEDSMGTTNGIEVSPDGKRLYVNESIQRNVWVYDLSDSGTVSNKRLLIQFSDFGMDGMRCDTEGNLYITRYDKGTVAKVSPDGKLIQEITLIGKKPSNIAFGGEDGKTAYVTLQDKGWVETFRVDSPGREWTIINKK